MALRCRKFFPVKLITHNLRRPFRRSHRDTAEAAVADAEYASQTAGVPADEDTELQLVQPLELNSGDVVIHGDHPVRAGTFADIWEGSVDGFAVVIKSYRRYSTTDSAHVRMRHRNEALACCQLSHPNIVPFRGVYATPKYALALVYDSMGRRCLREYTRETETVMGVRLLVDIARGLLHMHDMGIVHGNLATENVLVDCDGAARIAGLGSAFVPKNHGIWSERDADLRSYGTAPELLRPDPPQSRPQPTKESDIYAFALLAWELFAGHVPFPNIPQAAATYLLASGERPPRPDHPELCDEIWDLIERCWGGDPSCRPPIDNVLAILQEQLSKPLCV
ncbi:kinase-like domain-containing protein [Thelephora terrestris]|uniref:Kinase-like domain-containing protein n=1 Tax=Thelephora terrestris TaxID=56493 RepID=A0A9P6H9I8_9AGAM|nr:kinase-like domain-containing protein [Thelephora terrestris]